jgi:hypothetical protein
MDCERVDGAVGIGIRLHDDAVLIRLRENGRNDSLAEGIVQRVVDGAHADPEARGAVAVDGDVGREPVVFLIADDVGELRNCWRSAVTSLGVQVDTAVASALSSVNWYCVRLTVLSRVKSCTGCMYSVIPLTSAVSTRRRRITSATVEERSPRGFKLIKNRPLFSVTLLPSTPMKEERLKHVRIFENGGGERLLAIRHGGVGNRLRRFRDALNQTGVLIGKEALRNEHVQKRGERHRAESRPTWSGADDRAPR